MEKGTRNKKTGIAPYKKTRIMNAVKIIAILNVILIAFVVIANADVSTMQPANQITVAWDETADTTSYRVYTRLLDGTQETQIKEVTATQYTLTFTTEQALVIGVQAVRTKTLPGMTEPVEAVSAIAWSDIPENCLDGQTFGVYYIKAPGTPGGLRGL